MARFDNSFFRLPRLEPHRLRVFIRHENEDDPVEIRQLLTGAVFLPVKRVALEDQALAARRSTEGVAA